MLVKPYDPPSPIVNHLYGWFMTLLYYALLTIWKITTFHWWFNYQWAMFNRKLTSKKRLRVFEPLNQQLFVSSKRLEGFPAACETKLRVRWSWHPSHGPQNRLRDFLFFGSVWGHFLAFFLDLPLLFCFWYLLVFFRFNCCCFYYCCFFLLLLWFYGSCLGRAESACSYWFLLALKKVLSNLMQKSSLICKIPVSVMSLVR